MYNRNKRVISKVLSIILVITMILTGGVLNVFADFANKLMPLVENTSTIAEDESLREEYTKHFKMPDGSYNAISYTAPVHRKDANGNWVDIDNRMEETISKNKQAYVTSDGRMTFSKKINRSDNVVFNLSENGYGVKVSFNENDIKNTTAKLSNHAKKYVPNDSDSIPEQYKKVKVIDNNTTIQYKNLIKGMTLEYVLSSNDIKENIIINEKQEHYNYSFVYEFTGGLGAVLNDDGTVSLRDQKTDTDVYILPAPYMFDAEGNISENVEYQLTDLGNDKYSLNVIADSSWINDEKRAWPVVIDPTMSWVAGYYDTYIDSAHPNDNFGSSRELWVSSSRTTIMNHTFLPTIDDDVTINRATLNLSYYYNVSSGNVDVGLYQVTTNWEEHEVTWNSMSNFANGGISTVCRGTVILQASSTINASSPGSAAINITELVKDWYAGIPNYGVALKYGGGTNLSVILMSWETGNATRAKFEVSYSTGGWVLPNGTYYFNNGECDKYMQIDNDEPSSSNGAKLELWKYDGASDQRWTLEYLHNGYYKIVSEASGKVITAPATKDASLTQEYYNVSNNQLWEITSVSEGMYKLSPKSNTSYYMAAGDGVLVSDGRNVEMRSTMTDHKDEWILISTQDLSLIALPENYDRTSFFDSVITEMSSIGFVDCYDNQDIVDRGTNQGEIVCRIANSRITVIRTHGSKTSITTSNGTLSRTDINNMSSDIFDSSELVIYGACSTGSGREGAANLVNATHDRGSAIVIGFEKNVWSPEVNIWCDVFFQTIADEKSVLAACIKADQYVESNWYDPTHPEYDVRTNSWYIAGPSNTTFS